jgi:hypothetical protein
VKRVLDGAGPEVERSICGMYIVMLDGRSGILFYIGSVVFRQLKPIHQIHCLWYGLLQKKGG